MKILVTGGAGFIGSHIVDRYIQEGHSVIVADNFVTGNRDNLSEKIQCIDIDIRDSKSVDDLITRERFDVINHHAAQMDVRKSTEDPIYDAQVNILGSINLLSSAVKNGVRRFIYISTGGAAYGEPKVLPVSEDAPINPECPYGISKHTVEHYLYLYRQLYGLNYVILRYPNVYGPRQNPKGEAGVIAIFIGKMLRNQSPTIFGDGQQLRDYVYVGDIAEANILALKAGDGEIINLGSDRGTSVLELFDGLKRELNFNGKAQFANARAGEINRIYLTSSKAMRILGWQATVPLSKGLHLTVDWIKNNSQSS